MATKEQEVLAKLEARSKYRSDRYKKLKSLAVERKLARTELDELLHIHGSFVIILNDGMT